MWAKHAHPTSRRSSKTHEAERLLAQYPDLDRAERKRLERLLPRLPLIDQALLTADERLSAQLDAFYRDRRGRSAPQRHWLRLIRIGLLLFFAAALWMLFERPS